MPYPDALGACPELFPTAAQQRSERRAALAARLVDALSRIDQEMDELLFRIEGLASADGDFSYDDVLDAEAIANNLGILVAAHSIAVPAVAEDRA